MKIRMEHLLRLEEVFLFLLSVYLFFRRLPLVAVPSAALRSFRDGQGAPLRFEISGPLRAHPSRRREPRRGGKAALKEAALKETEGGGFPTWERS